MCIAWEDILVDCEFCGEPINLSRDEHTFRTEFGSVICLECRYPYECEHCGERCERLETVVDADPAVGYSNEIQVGECCLRRRA